MENPKLIVTIDELKEREWTYLGGMLDLDCEGGLAQIYCKADKFAVFDKRDSEVFFIKFLTREEALESILSLKTLRLLT